MKITLTIRTFLSFILLCVVLLPATAQIHGEEEEGEFFLGTISPVVLEKDATEISVVNSLSSFWIAFHEIIPGFKATRIADRSRFSRFDQLLRISHGFSKGSRWDIGADFRVVHTRLDEEAKSSPFRVLGNNSETGVSYRSLASVGLRTRIMLFKDVPELTFQMAFHYPMAKTPELRRRIGTERVQMGIMATYLQNLNPDTYYFLQGEWNVFIANEEHNQTTHLSALNGYLVFGLWQKQFFIYPGLTWVNAYQSYLNSSFKRINQQLYGGLGGQWQAGRAVGVSVFLQRPFIFVSGSQFSEWVRESYSSVTVGVRVLL
ncbi:MAG TPA: hypothetical protein ENJ20_02445 [Bacteroidetes bacterium]|nr:hypothetical protein [Bacteroidota bacterium]